MGNKKLRFEDITSEEEIKNLSEEQRKDLYEGKEIEIKPSDTTTPSEGGEEGSSDSSQSNTDDSAPAQSNPAETKPDTPQSENVEDESEKSGSDDKEPLSVEELQNRLSQYEEKEKGWEREKRGLISDLSEHRRKLRDMSEFRVAQPDKTIQEEEKIVDPLDEVLSELRDNPDDITTNESVLKILKAFEDKNKLQEQSIQQEQLVNEELKITDRMKETADILRKQKPDYDEVIKELPRIVNEFPGYWHAIREEARTGGDPALLAYETIKRKLGTGEPTGQPDKQPVKQTIPQRPKGKVLSSGGGTPNTQQNVTVEHVLSMSDEEFLRFQQEHPDKLAKLAGGK